MTELEEDGVSPCDAIISGLVVADDFQLSTYLVEVGMFLIVFMGAAYMFHVYRATKKSIMGKQLLGCLCTLYCLSCMRSPFMNFPREFGIELGGNRRHIK